MVDALALADVLGCLKRNQRFDVKEGFLHSQGKGQRDAICFFPLIDKGTQSLQQRDTCQPSMIGMLQSCIEQKLSAFPRAKSVMMFEDYP